MRSAFRLALAALAVAAFLAPAAHAAGPTATTAAPTATTPQPQPGGAFGPIQGLAGEQPQTQTQTVQNTSRPDDSGLGRNTLLLLSLVALGLIFGVAVLIWYEGRRSGATRRRRQRLRSGRTPQPATAGGQARRGPPPPPRKRRAQAKRKKR